MIGKKKFIWCAVVLAALLSGNACVAKKYEQSDLDQLLATLKVRVAVSLDNNGAQHDEATKGATADILNAVDEVAEDTDNTIDLLNGLYDLVNQLITASTDMQAQISCLEDKIDELIAQSAFTS